MEFKISREFLKQIEQLIQENKEQELHDLLHEIHYADIAEIMEELDHEEASYIFKICMIHRDYKIKTLKVFMFKLLGGTVEI